jgi:hypothetical protein
MTPICSLPEAAERCDEVAYDLKTKSKGDVKSGGQECPPCMGDRGESSCYR